MDDTRPHRVTRAEARIAFALANGLADVGVEEFRRVYADHGFDRDARARAIVFFHLATLAAMIFRAGQGRMIRGSVAAVVPDLLERIEEAQQADGADPHMCRKLVELMQLERDTVPGPPSGSDEVLAAAVVVCLIIDWRIRYAWDRTSWRNHFRIGSGAARRRLPVPWRYLASVT